MENERSTTLTIVQSDVCESIITKTFSIAVTAIDLDYGQNGNLTFNSSNDNFTVTSTDGKHGVVYATRYVWQCDLVLLCKIVN